MQVVLWFVLGNLVHLDDSCGFSGRSGQWLVFPTMRLGICKRLSLTLVLLSARFDILRLPNITRFVGSLVDSSVYPSASVIIAVSESASARHHYHLRSAGMKRPRSSFQPPLPGHGLPPRSTRRCRPCRNGRWSRRCRGRPRWTPPVQKTPGGRCFRESPGMAGISHGGSFSAGIWPSVLSLRPSMTGAGGACCCCMFLAGPGGLYHIYA